MTASVTHLYTYPIKSTIGNSSTSASVMQRGLQYDRQWGVFDKDGVAVTGRKFQDLLRVGTQVSDGNLRISLDGEPVFNVAVAPASSEELPARVFSGNTHGIPLQKEIDSWFSDLLQHECRLLHMPAAITRPVLAKHAGQEGDAMNYADQCPILLVSEASMDDLNGKLDEAIDHRHFRPNIVISGNAAFAEDTWKHIRVGDCTFMINQSCERCVFTTINPDSRLKHPRQEPLRTLLTYRRNAKGGPIFGVHMTARDLGMIRVGDKVEVLA
ncbi:MAG: MOSC domain-containing protein [Saprospiraceae bacterium]|nr:MOSC domain-containing protein [Saprospiraceae bacterium]